VSISLVSVGSVGWRRVLLAVLVRPEIGRVTPMPTFCPS
jgi:hypothetical protein